MASFQEQVKEAEYLADELNGLLSHYGSTLEHAGIRAQVEELAHLAECYRHGLHYGEMVADKIYQDKNAWLTSLAKRLKAEARALGRLEGEGGSTGSAATEISGAPTETEDFIGAVQKVDAIATHAENLFGLMDDLRRQISELGPEDKNIGRNASSR